MTRGYSPYVSHNYHFKLGDHVRIQLGRYAGLMDIVESAVFQRTVDYPNEYAAGYHVVLEDVRVVSVRWDRVSGR